MTLEWVENTGAGFVAAYASSRNGSVAVVDFMTHHGRHKANYWNDDKGWVALGHFLTIDQAKSVVENCKEIYK